MNTRRIAIVAAVIRDESGRSLLVRKRGTAVFQQPGGKRDPADTDDLATLARELREELGCELIRASAQWLCHCVAAAANEPGHIVEAVVYAVQVIGTISAQAEIEELRWIDPAAPGEVPIATLSREHILPLLSGTAWVGAASRRDSLA